MSKVIRICQKRQEYVKRDLENVCIYIYIYIAHLRHELARTIQERTTFNICANENNNYFCLFFFFKNAYSRYYIYYVCLLQVYYICCVFLQYTTDTHAQSHANMHLCVQSHLCVPRICVLKKKKGDKKNVLYT
jgi:hypothetical protein